jgi:hypothetical protein
MNINKYRSVSVISMNFRNIYKYLLVSISLFMMFFLAAPQPAHAADRYWVGGTGNWDASTTTHWSESSGGSTGASVPTSADNVIFDTSSSTANAAYTVTITATANCADFTMDGPDPADANRVTWAGSSTLNTYGNFNLSGGTAGINRTFTGNILQMGVTSGSFTFTSNGVSLASRIDFSSGGVVATWDLADALTTTGAIYIGGGTFNTNNYAITAATFANNNGGSKTYNLGTSTITLTYGASTIWRISNGTAPTINGASSTITCTAPAGTYTFEAGSYTYGTITFAGSSFTTTNATIGTLNLNGGTQTLSGNNTITTLNLTGTAPILSGANTITTLTRTGTATKTDTLTLGGNQIVGTLNLNGNSAINRLLVQSDVKGTQRTIAAAAVSIANADFQDITGAGAASWDLSAITGGSGDAGGNSGITFTTSATQTYVGGTYNWSDPTAWTSRVPLPQDDVIINTTTAGTLAQDMPRLGRNINFTGFTRTFTTSIAYSIFGSLTLSSGMSFQNGSDGAPTFEGRGSYNLTTNGTTINISNIYLNAPNGTLTLQDDLTINRSNYGELHITNGTFDANNKNLSIGSLESNNSNVRTIMMGSGTWTIRAQTNSGGYIWDLTTVTNLTFNKGTGTIKLTNNSDGYYHIFMGGGLAYDNFWDATQGTSVTRIVNSNTFNDFKIDAGRTVNFTAGTNTTVNTFTAIGTSGSHITIGSITSATHTLTKAGGGLIQGDYLDITYSTASPANTWYATNSTADGNTTGWTLTAIPGSTYKTLVGKGVDSYQVMTDSTNVYGYNNVTSVASTPLSSGAWHHVVMTYDGANQKIYIDGVLQTTNPATGVIRTNNSNLEIGQGFAGKIDDVKIYNRAISQEEITAAYGGYNAGIVVSDLQKGLVGQWKMDGNTKDSSSYRNHGSNYGAVLTTDRKGQANKAYSFNGSSNYVGIANSANISAPCAMSAWVKLTSRSSVGSPILGGSGYTSFRAEQYQSDMVGITASGDYVFTSPGYTVPLNAWTHLVAVINSSSLATLYVNGALSGTASGSNMACYKASIGKLLSFSDALPGSLDDVRIYNRVLSQTEITTLYQEYNPGIVVSDLQKGLVGNWRMDGNVKDSSSYVNHGTNNGAVLAPDRKGQANKSYTFDGSSSIDAGDINALDGISQMSISAWVNLNNITQSNKYVVSKALDDTHRISLGTSQDAGGYGGPDDVFLNLTGGGYIYGWTTANILTAGSWHHWAMVFDGTQSGNANVLKFYYDGIQQSLSFLGTIPATTDINSAVVRMGAELTGRNINASIDDVRIYNRALSSTEIRALYESY